MGSNLAARDVSNCSMRGFLSIQAFEYVFEYLLLQYSRAARISIHEKNKYYILTRVFQILNVGESRKEGQSKGNSSNSALTITFFRPLSL